MTAVHGRFTCRKPRYLECKRDSATVSSLEQFLCDLSLAAKGLNVKYNALLVFITLGFYTILVNLAIKAPYQTGYHHPA